MWGTRRTGTDTPSGPSRQATTTDGLTRYGHISDQLAVAAQANLTTMSDHNDTRRSRITADSASVSRPAHGQFPTASAYLTSEGSGLDYDQAVVQHTGTSKRGVTRSSLRPTGAPGYLPHSSSSSGLGRECLASSHGELRHR